MCYNVNGIKLNNCSNFLNNCNKKFYKTGFGLNCTHLLYSTFFQVDEPLENFDDAIEESIAFSEPEAGFKGTFFRSFLLL